MPEILVGRGFSRKYNFSKLDEIITHNKVTKNQSTGEREDQFLHLVEDGVSSEDGILIALIEEIDNLSCRFFEKEPSSNVRSKMHIVWNKNTPSAPHVHTV